MMTLKKQLVQAVRDGRKGKGRVPEAGAIIWEAFIALSMRRAHDQGIPNPISFTEIDAYCRVMRWPMEPHHVDMLLAMDDAWLATIQTGGKAKDMQKSAHGLTPDLFDVSFG
ncbi:hypothetical protein [Thioclava sp. GXIMD4215]|uniref:phage tail assembly chaperone n=1 Tax=Thioclava sp. GXIMD4215 TaxID=3131928 RepID=UPI0032569970